MSRNTSREHRGGPRYVVSFPVKAEWDAASGEHVIVEGETENIGPEGALVHLQQLPDVGSRVRLRVLDSEAGTQRVQVEAEVLRLERNPVQPLAALQLIGTGEEWRGQVWEHAAVVHNMRNPDDDEEFFD